MAHRSAVSGCLISLANSIIRKQLADLNGSANHFILRIGSQRLLRKATPLAVVVQ